MLKTLFKQRNWFTLPKDIILNCSCLGELTASAVSEELVLERSKAEQGKVGANIIGFILHST